MKMARRWHDVLFAACLALSVVACDSDEGGSLGGAAVERIPFAQPEMAASPAQREVLKYVASCALGPGQAITVDVDGEIFEFPGDIGLAASVPNPWDPRILPEIHQRWVSACIYARTNLFGVPVAISMRDRSGRHAELAASDAIAAEFDHFEAGFFGNYFVDPKQAFVCTPPHRSDGAEEVALELETDMKRVCSHDGDRLAPDGAPVSRCGFRITGTCHTEAAPQMGGRLWTEVIYVWLNPEAE